MFRCSGVGAGRVDAMTSHHDSVDGAASHDESQFEKLVAELGDKNR